MVRIALDQHEIASLIEGLTDYGVPIAVGALSANQLPIGVVKMMIGLGKHPVGVFDRAPNESLS